jgi:hypothetical protein
MKIHLGALALILAGLIAPYAALAAAPEIGEPAPEFRFEGEGGPFLLSDYIGENARKHGVVIAWFPKAFTAG